jgi:hypothetical protein
MNAIETLKNTLGTIAVMLDNLNELGLDKSLNDTTADGVDNAVAIIKDELIAPLGSALAAAVMQQATDKAADIKKVITFHEAN